MFPENVSKNFDRVKEIAFSDLPIDEKMRLFGEFDKILVADFAKNRKFYVPNCFLPISGFEDHAVNPFGNVIVSWLYDVRILSRDRSRGSVCLRNGRYDRKNKSVHILVAETFMRNPENKKYVNFKDGNRDNIRLDNLELSAVNKTTKRANNKDLCVRREKLSADEITKISEMLNEGEKSRIIAKKLNVSHHAVLYILAALDYGVNPIDLDIPVQTNQPKKVKCIENGKTYKSYKEAARDLKLCRQAFTIYFKRVGLGLDADLSGYHFIRVEEKES